jgi:hypothetical protein
MKLIRLFSVRDADDGYEQNIVFTQIDNAVISGSFSVFAFVLAF